MAVPEIKPGSFWRDERKSFAVHRDDNRMVRVMGVIEGYVVFRFKGAAPLLMSQLEFRRSFSAPPQPAEAEAREGR